MAVLPIWKDVYHDLGTTDGQSYTITHSGAAVYTGKAFIRPGQSHTYAKVNDVASNYLNTPLPTDAVMDLEEMSLAILRGGVNESVQISAVGTPTTYEFRNDWSFQDYTPLAGFVLSDPIRDEVMQWSPFLLSFDGNSIGLRVRNSAGGMVCNAGAAGSLGTMVDASATFFQIAKDDTDGTLIKSYDVVPQCAASVVLYYVNAFGGWDHLLMKGRNHYEDGYTRHEYGTALDNSNAQNRGRVNHANEIERTWTMNTGWLTDAQSLKMHHLLGSTSVYLYDVAEGTFQPVILTNADAPYKTYHGEGNKMVNYTLTAVIAKDLVRR